MSRFGAGNGREPLRAGVTAVYAKADGTVVWLRRPLRPFEAISGGYRTRYDVGMADFEHEFVIADELPSKEDVFRFYARVQFGFRVHDAAEVVRRRVQNGFLLARWRLLQYMRDISRRYMTEDCGQANAEINATLGQQPVVFPEGITVYRFAAFLSLDAQTQDALQRKRATEHDIDLARKTHELEQLRAHNQWELEQGRMAAVQLALKGDNGLLVLHMTQHPEDTEGVLRMVAESHERNRSDAFAMFKSMAEHGLLQNIDVQDIRDENLRNLLQAARADALAPLRVSETNVDSEQRMIQAEASIPLPPAPPNHRAPADSEQ
jgi:hypothetical protein